MDLRRLLLAAVLVLAAALPAASGFECWFCSATPGRDESCDSTETAATSKISCPKGVQKCLKTVIKEDDGSLDISRSCVVSADAPVGCRGDVEGAKGGLHCVCEGELCNGAESRSAAAAALAVCLSMVAAAMVAG